MATETQQAPSMQAEPQSEHRWLQKFIGEWTWEVEWSSMSGVESGTGKGSEVVRAVGDLWIQAEGVGEWSEGGTQTTITTLGYDPQKKKFVGTFIGSEMAYLWQYEGELDAGEKVLTLDSEGPDMATEGRLAKYKDIHEFKSDDHRTVTARVLGEDGKWQEFMTTHYRRK
jgi:Protein of unknown function (DUF1579)